MKVVQQRTDFDCGFAAIAMLLDVPYNDVRDTVYHMFERKQLLKKGLILKQLEAVIAKFGFKTKRSYRKGGYLEGATGILGLNGGDCDPAGHWVVLKDGQIVDPSGGEVWDPDDYVLKFKCRPATMVVLV